MSKGHQLVLTVAACLVLTPAAVARTTLSAGVAVTPENGGTPRHPQGHKLAIRFDLNTPGGVDRPMVTGFEVWHGPGLAFDRGQGYATCSQKRLARLGPGGCPPESRVGDSSGGGIEPPDDPAPRFVTINGPGQVPLLYGTLQRPARVRAVIAPTVVDNPRSIWPHRTSWTVPKLFQVVAGIPITMNTLKLTYGYTKAAPLFVASTSCPKGGWAWKVRVHLMAASGATTLAKNGRAPCHR